MPKKANKQKGAPADPNNPENLPSAPTNSLFGKKGGGAADEAVAAQKQERKRPRPEVMREDPAAATLRAEKRRKKDSRQAGGSDGRSPKGESSSTAAPSRSVRPHAAEVEQSTKLWEKLRSDKTEDVERSKLIDEVLALFEGKVISVLQKHDAARVLQSCFKQGSTAQRDALLREVAGKCGEIARSHYGHFLLLSIVRNGAAAHKKQLVEELLPRAADLLVHAEGSAVLQLLYADVASNEQRNAMYRTMWGKEMALFQDAADATTLAELFERDPLSRARVLRRLEILLSKAARKGLALTSLVQRGGAELLEHGDTTQRAELVGMFREQAAHMMHTRDGARIACGCVRYGDAKDRKAMLKAFKGYVARAAQDPNGALVLCVALEAVDDTVLLSKALLSELSADLSTLAQHPHGVLPFLQLLAPRSSSYFTPAQISIMGDQGTAVSKKDPAVRRAELLGHVLPALLKLCTEHPLELACSAHGSHLLFETVRVAADAAGNGLGEPAANPDALAALFAALAAVATEKEGTSGHVLVAHPLGARVVKRLAQQHPDFADALLSQLAGQLLKLAQRGAGWVVLALLENSRTQKSVLTELKGSAAALSKSSAAGCRSLSDALKKAAK
jgi:pumilio family protein 6